MDTLAHGGPGAPLAPPPLSPTSLVTEADLVHWLTIPIVLAAALYLFGVVRLRARGDRWPLTRTVSFLLPGLGSIALVVLSGLAAYEKALLSAHMTQHMVLSMVSPIFLALGAPVTLALRTLPKRPRRVLLAVVHSPPVRFFTLPLVAFGIIVASPFVLYFTDLYQLSLENELVHEWVHLHFVVSGLLFFAPLVGLDPLPGRWPHAGRVLLLIVMVPFHTVLGLTIMQSETLVGGDWYLTWAPAWSDPFADQRLAGGILWASGELITVTVLTVLVAQWIRASEREARRIDRELDRAEAAAARAAESAGSAEPGGSAGPAGPAGSARGTGAAGTPGPAPAVRPDQAPPGLA